MSSFAGASPAAGTVSGTKVGCSMMYTAKLGMIAGGQAEEWSSPQKMKLSKLVVAPTTTGDDSLIIVRS